MNKHHIAPSLGSFPWAKFLPGLGIVGGLALAASQWLVFIYAPVESTMGIAQKIFYLHLPMAWWGLFSFFIVFVASIAYLLTKKTHWDALAEATGSVGLVLSVLALVTGMFWARRAWGVWWTWDARLTTTLVMCFVYAGYLLLRRLEIAPVKRSTIASVVGIVAFLDVPLVYFSARQWSYIHPPSITLEPEMKLTLIACIVAFGLLWLPLVLLRCRATLLQGKLDTLATARILAN